MSLTFLKKCDRYCAQSNIPVCDQCTSSREHTDHEIVDMVRELERKSKVLESDLQDLDNRINPKYQEIASSITVQKNDLNKDSQKLKTDNNHGEDLNREIDSTIKKMIHDMSEIDSKYLASINKKKTALNILFLKSRRALRN